MVTVWGAPEPYSSFPMVVKTGILWDDCVQECFSNLDCMLAYGNSSLLCALYGAGDVRKIRNDKEASGTLEKASVKIQTTNKCSIGRSGMFDGTITNFSVVTMFINYEIITSDDFYTINFNSERIKNCGIQIGPEIDCSDCDKTMMVFRGTADVINRKTSVWTSSFYACVIECFDIAWCVGAYKTTQFSCSLFSLGQFQSSERTEDLGLRTPSIDYSYVVLKFSPLSSNCPPTYTSLFSGKHESKSGPFTSYSSYLLTTTDTQTTLEPKFYNKTCEDKDLFTLDGIAGCYGFFSEPAMYPDAIERCKANHGDGLMTLPDTSTLVKMNEARKTILPNDFVYFVGYSRTYNPDGEIYSEWVWSLPHLKIDDSVAESNKDPFEWANNLYGEINFEPSNAVFQPQIEFYNGDGYICHFPDRKQ